MSSAEGSSEALTGRHAPMSWVTENLYSDWAQAFRVTREVAFERSSYQEIRIVDTVRHGRVMLLDGVVQITESDEFVYQEMIVHVPFIQHGAVRTVLIIGAGDGGVLKRVLLHDTVERVTLVEIDEAVVRLARAHLPAIGGTAWEDSRAKVIIGDGVAYTAQASTASVDVIIVDSTDPAGPGEALFTVAFYQECARILAPGGMLVNQCGVPFMQPGELKSTTQLRRAAFNHVSTFVAAVPTYIGGFMAFGIAGNSSMASLSIDETEERAARSGLTASSRYWAPSIHLASFALPPFIAELMTE